MKLQNLSIIFLAIAIPLILILSYYLNLQQDTLELQAQYDLKLAEATKEGIKAFEVNTVDWSEWTNNQTNVTRRNNAMATINTFLTSLSNNLNISGTAKEYITNYIPAAAVTMYDGYYVYAPIYAPIPWETPEGVQLYYDEDENNDGIENDGILTDNSEMGVNLPAYKASSTAINYKEVKYKYMNSEDNEITSTETVKFVTDINQAQTEYKHMLSNQIAYSARYSKTHPTTNVIVNYTLDNRIYVYGTIDGEYIEEDGYLVYFDSTAKLPMIYVTAEDPKNDADIYVRESVGDAMYGNTYIEPEILEEQILYSDGTNYKLETFKYVYNIEDEKLYYDEGNKRFFRLRSDKTKDHISETAKPTGSNMTGCEFKSVSVLWGKNGNTTEYKKIYQLLNGPDQGNWYISIKEDPISIKLIGKEQIDTKLGSTKLTALGLSNSTDVSNICKVYSATSYYVEAYAFTNWARQNLGGVEQEIYSEAKNEYEPTNIQVEGTTVDIFDITKNNDPEMPYSPIVLHKKQIMQEHITSNLNLSISNYGRGTYQFKMPVLTESDWEQVFSNISLITFFQGIPIGLKHYNNYAIATSNTNREYVDPGELYFTGADNTYHRVYCKKCGNITYTGYRSVEYTLREYVKHDTSGNITTGPIYYYQHDKYNVDDNSETACYYCLVNKENFEYSTDPSIQYIQTKAYNEALARERYYQKETLEAKLGVNLIYHENLEIIGEVIAIDNMPENQLLEIGVKSKISTKVPKVTTNDPLVKYVFVGWSEAENSKNIAYSPGQDITCYNDQDKHLWAVWRISLANLDWNMDFYWKSDTPGEYKGDWSTKWTYQSNGKWSSGPFAKKVQDGSISYIDVSESTNGSRIQMVGNGVYKGKGAVWATFDSEYLEIAEFQFDYIVNKGDSFNAAGFMFNITETSDTLEGYMLSINFTGAFYSESGYKNGAIYKFTYNKGNCIGKPTINKNNVESIDLIEALDFGTYSDGAGSSGGGSITIKVTPSGYVVTGSEIVGDINVPVSQSELNPDTFGFFSDHYRS